MEISINQQAPIQAKSNCLILPMGKQPDWDKLAQALNQSAIQLLQDTYQQPGFNGKQGQALLLYPQKNLQQYMLLLGIGDQHPCSFYQFDHILNNAWQALQSYNITQACSLLHLAITQPLTLEQALTRTITSYYEHSYAFTDYKTSTSEAELLNQLECWVPSHHHIDKRLIDNAKAIGECQQTARHLSDLPANQCHPPYLEHVCEQLAQQFPTIDCNSLTETQMQEYGMGALLSVAHGSEQPAKLITMHYNNGGNDQPIALIGKGITFDTGGYQLKAPSGMLPMKYDMCGSAAVIALVEFCAKLHLPINIVGVVAAAENMISDRATRLSDIVSSMSGQTIEITNSDAEGRLALCDAMTYTQQYFKPSQMITTATLTGAALLTFEHVYAALMGNNTELKQAIQKAGDQCGDLAWPLPMHEAYEAKLKSPFADIVNTPTSREASTIIAAHFLEQFVDNTDWAHVDVAGSASAPKDGRVQSTGRPVPLLAQYLLQQSQ